MKTEMRRLGSVVWLLAVFSMLGCNKSKTDTAGTSAGAGASTGAGKTQVRMALNWVPEPEFGGFYAARAQGIYERNGLSVELIGGGSSVPVLQMVATGQVDFSVVTADEMLIGRAHGADVVPVYAIFQTSPQAIMTHAARGAKSMQDVLSGGTLSAYPGATFTAFLKKKYGFDKTRIVPYDGGVSRFLTDKEFSQQCFATSEPLAARKQGGDPVVFKLADEGWNPYMGVVITRRALWEKSPQVVRAFVRASREGWQSYQADPGPANAVMVKLNPTMDAATFAEVAAVQRPFVEGPESQQPKPALGAMQRERWQTLIGQVVDLGLIDKGKEPRVDDFLVAVD